MHAAKFLLEFSLKAKQNIKRCFAKERWLVEEEEKRRRKLFFTVFFFEAVPYVLLTGGRGDEASIVFSC